MTKFLSLLSLLSLLYLSNAAGLNKKKICGVPDFGKKVSLLSSFFLFFIFFFFFSPPLSFPSHSFSFFPTCFRRENLPLSLIYGRDIGRWSSRLKKRKAIVRFSTSRIDVRILCPILTLFCLIRTSSVTKMARVWRSSTLGTICLVPSDTKRLLLMIVTMSSCIFYKSTI